MKVPTDDILSTKENARSCCIADLHMKVGERQVLVRSRRWLVQLPETSVYTVLIWIQAAGR